jgi:hypothetical protein
MSVHIDLEVLTGVSIPATVYSFVPNTGCTIGRLRNMSPIDELALQEPFPGSWTYNLDLRLPSQTFDLEAPLFDKFKTLL